MAFLAPIGAAIASGATAAGSAVGTGAAAVGHGALAAANAIPGAAAAGRGTMTAAQALGHQMGFRAAMNAPGYGLSSLPQTAGPMTLDSPAAGSSLSLGANGMLAPPGSALPLPGATSAASLLDKSIGPVSGPGVGASMGIPGGHYGMIGSLINGIHDPEARKAFAMSIGKHLFQGAANYGKSQDGGGGASSGGAGGGNGVSAMPVPAVADLGAQPGPVPPSGAEGFGGAGTQLSPLLPQAPQDPQSDLTRQLLARQMAYQVMNGAGGGGGGTGYGGGY